MSTEKSGKEKKNGASAQPVDKTICVSDSRIDRAGNAWKQKSLWLRQEHLGKLKVMEHFHETKIEVLIDRALGEYIKKNFEDKMSMEKMVQNAAGKVPATKG